MGSLLNVLDAQRKNSQYPPAAYIGLFPWVTQCMELLYC